jgi:hypothetical protein
MRRIKRMKGIQDGDTKSGESETIQIRKDRTAAWILEVVGTGDIYTLRESSFQDENMNEDE